MKIKRLIKRQTVGLLMAAMLLVLMIGCAKSNDSMKYESNTAGSSADYGGDRAYEQSAAEAPSTTAMSDEAYAEEGILKFTATSGGADLSNRKIIETREVYMETLTFEETVDQVEALVYSAAGYIEASTVTNRSFGVERSYQPRRAYYTLRVPAEYFSGFMETLTGLAHVVNNNVNKDDVTAQFMDIEARLNALIIQEERLLALLENSARLQDILELERELSSVRYSIESFTSTLNELDNRVRFSTVYLSLNEVFEIKEIAPVPITVGERISSGFKNALENIGDFFVDLFVWLVANSPYLILWAVVIGVWISVIRYLLKKSKKNRIKAQEAAACKDDTNGVE